MKRVYIIKDPNNKLYQTVNNIHVYVTEDGMTTSDKAQAYAFPEKIAEQLLTHYNQYCNGYPYWIIVDKLPEDKYIPSPGDIFIEHNNPETENLKFLYIDQHFCYAPDPKGIFSGVDQNGVCWSFFVTDELEKIGTLNNVI